MTWKHQILLFFTNSYHRWIELIPFFRLHYFCAFTFTASMRTNSSIETRESISSRNASGVLGGKGPRRSTTNERSRHWNSGCCSCRNRGRCSLSLSHSAIENEWSAWRNWTSGVRVVIFIHSSLSSFIHYSFIPLFIHSFIYLSIHS